MLDGRGQRREQRGQRDAIKGQVGCWGCAMFCASGLGLLGGRDDYTPNSAPAGTQGQRPQQPSTTNSHLPSAAAI